MKPIKTTTSQDNEIGDAQNENLQSQNENLQSQNEILQSPTSLGVTLHTERLVLSPFAESDAEGVETLLNDKEIASNTKSVDYPYPKGDAIKCIRRQKEKWETGELFVFAIRQRSTGELVGAIGLDVNGADCNAELGYWVGRAFWNLGYCTEAARKVIEYGFDTVGLYRIVSHHMVRNPASGRVLEKIGMTREGLLRSHGRKWGVFEDIVVFGMLASDPRPGRTA